jgi:hypothetical protein
MGFIDSLFSWTYSPAKKDMYILRENMKKSISIMSGCRNRDDVIAGFDRVKKILERNDPSSLNNPLLESINFVTRSLDTNESEATALIARDACINEYQKFLSATENWRAL